MHYLGAFQSYFKQQELLNLMIVLRNCKDASKLCMLEALDGSIKRLSRQISQWGHGVVGLEKRLH